MVSRYSQHMSRLIPVKRLNVNNHLVTKWVREEDADSQGSSILSGSTAAMAQLTVPTNVNWDKMSNVKARSLLESVKEDIENPDKLWQNFDFLNEMMESKHAPVLLSADDGVAESLRDTWLNMHGANAGDSSTYENLGGDDGYQAYRSAVGEFGRAGNKAIRELDWNSVSTADASSLADSIVRDLDKPSELWRNFEMLKGLFESKHDKVGLDTIDFEQTGLKLRDTWLKSDGLNIEDKEGYASHPNYIRYQNAYRDYGQAARQSRDRHNA